MHFVLAVPKRQAIPDQNPKSEARNPKQTEKLKSEIQKSKSETSPFGILCFLII